MTYYLCYESTQGEYLISTTCTNSVIPSTVPFVSSHSSSRFFFDSAALIEHCKLVGVSCYFEQSRRAVPSSSTQLFFALLDVLPESKLSKFSNKAILDVGTAICIFTPCDNQIKSWILPDLFQTLTIVGFPSRT